MAVLDSPASHAHHETKSDKPFQSEFNKQILIDFKQDLQRLLDQRLDEFKHQMRQFTASEQSQEDRIENIVRKSMEKYVEDKLIKDLKNTFNCLVSNNYNEVFED